LTNDNQLQKKIREMIS